MLESQDTGFYSLIADKTKDFKGQDCFIGRQWLFSEIKSWLANPNGLSCFLIIGKAGTGKSAISARLWQISEGEIENENLEKGFLTGVLSISEKYYEKNHGDIKKYINFRITKEGKLTNHYDEFASDLAAKSGDNFLYVTFLLDAFVEGTLELTKENLDRLPPFLHGLYHEFFSRIRRKDINKWNNELKIILTVLSVVYRGVNHNQLAFLAKIHPLRIQEDMLELKSFIRSVQVVYDGSTVDQYSLYHQSLIDFLSQKEYRSRDHGVESSSKNLFYVKKQHAHRLIAEKYYSTSSNAINIHLIDKDDYGLRYIAFHLSELVDYQDYERINWYEQLLQPAGNDTFERMQVKAFPLEPNFNSKIKN